MEPHGDRREEDLAELVGAHVTTNDLVQVAEDSLMPNGRRRRHDQIAVENLVAVPVFGQRQEFLPAELDAKGGAIFGRHAHDGSNATRAACSMPRNA